MAGMVPFDFEDALALDGLLTDDERMIRDAARAFAQDRLAPRVIKAFADEHTDPEEVARGAEVLARTLLHLAEGDDA